MIYSTKIIKPKQLYTKGYSTIAHILTANIVVYSTASGL